ncbi:MAG TPA: SagB/ThcOx family dehydrogenase [Candidatus Acidoferrales bacterium]|nr:SagB/ThcOx family dehydrogenase [Candidatus Acidoferrales bacterium]
MNNRDLEAAWTYHNRTKHSYGSVRSTPHFLDWSNEPLLFKVYPTLEPLPLPQEFPHSGFAALSAIAQSQSQTKGNVLPDLNRLGALLYFSAGITKRRTYPGREIFYRAAACTGALYETELYLVSGDLPDLPAGVYHFGPGDFALRRLRSGDYRGVLLRATGAEPAISHAPLSVVCTGTYWRNAWKYQARTYRHFGWDGGMILANLLSMCTALKLPARVVLGFVDGEVNRLLDLETKREVAFSLVSIGHVTELPPESPRELEPLELQTVPLSKREVDYPAMRAMHDASSLHLEREVAEWRGGAPAGKLPAIQGACVSLEPYEGEEISRDPIEEVILRRGSARRFARAAISFAQLSTILDRVSRGIPADFLDPESTSLNDLYLIVHAVEGLRPGAYVFHREGRELECLKEGEFRQEAGYLGLEQELAAEASATVFFLADLRRILNRFGNRGYRAVQLEAGILGGKLYLAAYAQHLGATGLTFYDDDTIAFFSPHAEGKSAIFLTALGKSAKRKR